MGWDLMFSPWGWDCCVLFFTEMGGFYFVEMEKTHCFLQ